MRFLFSYITILACIRAVLCFSQSHQDGYCVMYDNCGKKSIFGSELPCVNYTRAIKPSLDAIKLLNEVCGSDFPTDLVCCSESQIMDLGKNLKKAAPIISSCPACKKNFQNFFCDFTCSPNQSAFVNITNSGISSDKGKEIVTGLTLYINPGFASRFYNSCKDVKFSATNGYAMDLIGGGARNFKEFLKFLGDEKPLLGGSPFQINYEYEISDAAEKQGLRLAETHMRPCDDREYGCSCSDCPTSCPELPKFKGFNGRCRVGKLPCFSLIVICLWTTIVVLIGAYHVYLMKLKKNAWTELEREFESETRQVEHFCDHDDSAKTTSQSYHEKFIKTLESYFERIARLCSRHPKNVIIISLFLSFILSCGISKIKLERNPINLWVSPNEPALKEMQYFQEHFGEWFRIEQLIISSKNESEPVLNWDNIAWWFEKEKELANFEVEEGELVSYDELCFKPTEETCAIESFTQYFRGDINYLNERNWKQKLQSCTDSPVNCLPSFQQPLKKNILFSSDDVLNSSAFIVTLLLNNNLSDVKYTEKAIRYEQLLVAWALKLEVENPKIQIHFSTEMSLEEELNKTTHMDLNIILLSYFLMFVYASISLSRKLPSKLAFSSFIKTRILLGLCGIGIILMSVTSSVGLFSFVGLKSTLIIAEVIPFLVLAIGIDNIFLIVGEFDLLSNTSKDSTIETRLALTLSKIGPSCLMSTLLQFAMFLLASKVPMPAVRNFAIYSAGAILINFFLQVTCFVSIFYLDQQRLESNRLDIFPWIIADNRIMLTDENQEENLKEGFEDIISDFIKLYVTPRVTIRSKRRKLLSVFIIWLGVSLSLLPTIELGLDQRLALPSESYLVDYFNAVYQYLNVGPPLFFVLKGVDVTQRNHQQQLCGKFTTCEKYSVANILEQEYKRSNVSSIAEPTSSWLDDFLTWLNPDLDQCCRVKKNDKDSFCSVNSPERLCQPCYADHKPPYDSSMNAFPTSDEFMRYFNVWIEQPSDPCPLGGKSSYSNSISVDDKNQIAASYFRTSHVPLRSQSAFINAYENGLRIVKEIKSHIEDIEIFAFSPFYVYFALYVTISRMTFTLIASAICLIWVISTLLLGSFRASTILITTVTCILVNIGGILSLWSVSLNPVSLVNLIICGGFAVEFTTHITRAYTLAESVDPLDRRASKTLEALKSVGSLVFCGITLTKFIGVCVLGFARSKIYEIFYFRMWFSLIIVAAIHAFGLLPILLSEFGPISKTEILEQI